MPSPIARIPCVLSRPLLHLTAHPPARPLAPTLGALFSRFPAIIKAENVAITKSGSSAETANSRNQQSDTGHATPALRSTGVATGSSKIFGIFGTKNSDKVIGARTLHHTMCRTICSSSKDELSKSEPLFKPSKEPFGSAIKSQEPEFLKAGLIKIQEDGSSVIFTDGTQQLRIVTEHYIHPSQTGYFIDKNGNEHCIWNRQRELNPEQHKKEEEELDAIWHQYELSGSYAQLAKNNEAVHTYLMLSFRHMINFMETNKKTSS